MSNTKLCSTCILPESYPNVTINTDGVCNYCNAEDNSNSMTYVNADIMEANREKNIDDFEKTVDELKLKDIPYHGVLAFSGGKDSNYLYYLLTEKHHLRIKAVSVDMGFESDICLSNLASMKKILKDNLEIVKIPLDITKKLYKKLIMQLDDNSDYVDSVCNVCHALILFTVVKQAYSNKIPVVFGGHTPDESVFVYEITKDMFELHNQLINQTGILSKDEMGIFWPEEYDMQKLPRIISPFHALPYNSDEIRIFLDKKNLMSLSESDFGVTNCKILDLMVNLSISRNKPVPYVSHFSEQIRKGYVSRESALASVEKIKARSMRIGNEIAELLKIKL